MASLNNKLMNTFPNSAVFAHDPPGRKSSVYLSMWPWHSCGDRYNRKRVIIKLNLGGMLMTNATSKRNGCPKLTGSARYEGDGYGNICGNKMPTRCNRGFYCLLNMFRAPLCPSSWAEEYYTVVAACGISCCGFQVAGLVWSWGLCVRFAGCCLQHTTGSNHCIILLSSWWCA